MPGFDGTGPRGMGPMSGSGAGFCVIRHPDGPKQGVTGYAGYFGRPIGQDPGLRTQLDVLRDLAREIEDNLEAIYQRIRTLELRQPQARWDRR